VFDVLHGAAALTRRPHHIRLQLCQWRFAHNCIHSFSVVLQLECDYFEQVRLHELPNLNHHYTVYAACCSQVRCAAVYEPACDGKSVFR
jgi:hypothetical protein